jgi:hypothetical protein
MATTRTTPTSFRLRPGTLAQLDRVAELLTLKFRRRLDEEASPELTRLAERAVSRSEALAVCVADTLTRLERELGFAPDRPEPYRSAADRGRGLLAHVSPGASLVDELAAERRAEAAAEAAAEERTGGG